MRDDGGLSELVSLCVCLLARLECSSTMADAVRRPESVAARILGAICAPVWLGLWNEPERESEKQSLAWRRN